MNRRTVEPASDEYPIPTDRTRPVSERLARALRGAAASALVLVLLLLAGLDLGAYLAPGATGSLVDDFRVEVVGLDGVRVKSVRWYDE